LKIKYLEIKPYTYSIYGFTIMSGMGTVRRSSASEPAGRGPLPVSEVQ
jgi:hypothetical protein